MNIITAAWQAIAGKENELKAHLQTMVDAVRANEPDCMEYLLHQSPTDEGSFLFYEQYKNQAAIDAHVETPHFKKLIAETKNLIAKEVDVKFYDLLR